MSQRRGADSLLVFSKGETAGSWSAFTRRSNSSFWRATYDIYGLKYKYQSINNQISLFWCVWNGYKRFKICFSSLPSQRVCVWRTRAGGKEERHEGREKNHFRSKRFRVELFFCFLMWTCMGNYRHLALTANRVRKYDLKLLKSKDIFIFQEIVSVHSL